MRPNPFPGSTVLDRYHDWQDAMDDLTCTRECGAARNNVCRCRCQGLHHNAAHDYWSTLPRETWTEYLPGGSTILHKVAAGLVVDPRSRH